MKKNIVIGVLVLTNILFLLYAFQQKSEADTARVMAIEQRLLAEEQMKKALEAAKMALQQAELARLDAIKAKELAAQ